MKVKAHQTLLGDSRTVNLAPPTPIPTFPCWPWWGKPSGSYSTTASEVIVTITVTASPPSTTATYPWEKTRSIPIVTLKAKENSRRQYSLGVPSRSEIFDGTSGASSSTQYTTSTISSSNCTTTENTSLPTRLTSTTLATSIRSAIVS